MASTKTGIEWTDKTWNPTTGCDKVSLGCKNCYALEITRRFKSTFPNGFKFTLHPDRLYQPKSWKKPSRIFVDSMSDLFHEEMPLDYLKEIFSVMADCPQHVFQVLTKRAERLSEISPTLEWPDNVWMGVSVETQKYVYRVQHLKQSEAKIKFLSCEPLLGPLELDLEGIDWVITGGESGKNHRPIDEDWVRSIRDQCIESRVAFFHKQWGGSTPKRNGRMLDGRFWDEMPTAYKDVLSSKELEVG